MNADAELDSALGWHTGVALDHGILNLDGAAYSVYYTAKFGNHAVTGAFHDTTNVHGKRRIDQIAAQSPQSRQRAVLIGTGEPAETDHIGGQDGHQTAL